MTFFDKNISYSYPTQIQKNVLTLIIFSNQFNFISLKVIDFKHK